MDVWNDLVTAELAEHPADRYLAAQLAALRATAAVFAVRPPRRSGRHNAWRAVAEVAPELSEWADFFRVTQAKRDAVAAGVRNVVTAREADDMLRDAQQFCAVVTRWGERRRNGVGG